MFHCVILNCYISVYRKPSKLSVVWTRRSRRVTSEPLPWEPTMKDPLRGVVVWAVPENKEVSVTLFKDARTQVMEDKEWTFAIEDVRRNFTVLLVLCMSVKLLSTN